MNKINVTNIKFLDIAKLRNVRASVVGDSIELIPTPNDESDYENGMHKAMQKIAVSCGRAFGADIGHEDLPDLVESILRRKKETVKPTPTKFVKVEESIFDLKEEFEKGELFTKKAWGEYVLIKEDTHLALLYEMQSHENSKIGIYRKVEIDWRDEVVGFLGDENIGSGSEMTGDILNALLEVDWGYIKESDFISLCHLVASLTEKPEGV